MNHNWTTNDDPALVTIAWVILASLAALWLCALIGLVA